MKSGSNFPFAAIYLLYAKLEEEYGLARHAMAVYERATQAVLPSEKHDMYNIYIKRAAEIYGVTHTRSIYEKAIEVSLFSLNCIYRLAILTDMIQLPS